MTTEIVNLLKKLEGYQQYPYYDYKGYSIGYGHFIGQNNAQWTSGISKQQAHDLLLDDINKMEGYVIAYLPNLSSRQLDAITLFTFNFGPAKIKEATFIKYIKEGNTNTQEIETWWRKWNKAGGKYSKNLEQRRIMETDIFYEREIRMPDYIGGGTLNLNSTTTTLPKPTSSNPNTSNTYFSLPSQKKFPVLPFIAGITLLGTGGYIFYRTKKKTLNGFSNIPFWAKAAIAGGVILIGGATYMYGQNSNIPKPLPFLIPNNSSIPTMTAELTQNNKLLAITVGDLAISNEVENLTKHKTKKYGTRKLSQLTHIILHHSAGNPNESLTNIANQHVKDNGWAGIGYHFVISPDGTVNQTNYVTTISNHVALFNTGCIGISFPGNFDINHNIPTDAQIASGKKLVLALQSAIQKAIGRKLIVKGHKEVAKPGHATACPGRYFPLETFHNL